MNRDDKTYAILENNQKSLNGVFLLLCQLFAMSIIKQEKDISISQKYILLKNKYNSQIFVIFSIH